MNEWGTDNSLLLASLLSLCLGPAIYHLLRAEQRMLLMLDGFIFVTIPGIVLLTIVPPILSRGHWWSILFGLVGMFAPTLTERFFRKGADRAHLTALVLGLVGLCLHAAADGAALTTGFSSPEMGDYLLPFAIILHRFPVGLTIWWLMRPVYGFQKASIAFLPILLATALGFLWGPRVIPGLSSQGVDWFQALVAGSLMHVVVHQPGAKVTDLLNSRVGVQRWFSGVGSLLGVILLLSFLNTENLFQSSTEGRIVSTFFQLALKSAPPLILAYLAAGFMSSFLTKSSIAWMRRGQLWNQSMRGMAVGLPFPICSCGVVPLYRTLIQSGAPATAAMAFLISTPELGLDAILISIPLLGSPMTVIRVIAAALVAFLIGWLVGRLVPTLSKSLRNPIHPIEVSPKRFLRQKIQRGLASGFGDAVDHTAPWIIFGLALAAVSEPFLQANWLNKIPRILEIPVFALLGLPTYVCASSATPFVAVLLAKGVSPGAALAFLLTGPATNITTFGVLGKLHGKKIAIYFSIIIMLLSIGMGSLANVISPQIQPSILEGLANDSISVLEILCLSLLTGLYLFSLLKRGARQFVGEISLKGQHT